MELASYRGDVLDADMSDWVRGAFAVATAELAMAPITTAHRPATTAAPIVRPTIRPMLEGAALEPLKSRLAPPLTLPEGEVVEETPEAVVPLLSSV